MAGKAINMTGGGGGNAIKLVGIEVTTMPKKTVYLPGERFDTSGMIVTATYSNGATLNATGYSYTPDGEMEEGTSEVTISYTEGGKSFSTSISITVERATIQVPSQSGSLTYNGGSQSPVWSNYDSSKMTISGQTSGVDAGTYTASFTPTYQYKWTDGGIDTRNVSWSIGKATGKVTLNPTSLTLNTDNPNGTILVTRLGTGTITAESNNTGVVTTSVSGTTVNVLNVNQTNGDAIVTVNVSADTNYTAASAQCSVNAEFGPLIYGAEWSGTSSPIWSRTDAAELFSDPNPAVNNGNGSSPFDNILPWSGMEIEEDSVAGTLVKIPKYYYKWTRSGLTMKLQISAGEFDGSHVSPAHADRGDGQGERDVVYVGRYHCSSAYKSQTGQMPLASITRATARSNISALGAEYWQYDFAIYWTIMMLYLVEFANWNSQAVIGYGCSPNSKKFNVGLTDNMQYHTGTSAVSRDTYGCCQYRHIEGLWDNVDDWCDGIYFSGAKVFCIKNPDSFSDTSGGTNVGTMATSSGYISGWTNPTADGFEYSIFPNSFQGSETTYVCDSGNYPAYGVVLYSGGYFGNHQTSGAFCLYGNVRESSTLVYIGCRLMKLPNT